MKKIMFLLLAILGITAVAMAMNKTIEIKKEENKVLSTMWFELNVSNANDPYDPEDTESEIIDEGNPTSSCDPLNTEEVCGIELDVTNLLILDPNYDFTGKTVAQVIADGAEHIEDADNNPKSYSRRP